MEKDVSVDDILTAIRDAYGESYLPDGEIPAEMLEMEFGLAPELYDEAKGEMAMITMHNDRVVVVKAKADKGDAVEAALNEARERKVADTLQYPMNVPKTNASRIVRNGRYLAFLLVGALPEDLDISEEERIKFAEDEVQKGVDAFNAQFA